MPDLIEPETAPIWWWGTATTPLRPSLAGDAQADVLVVGAGLAGTATAYFLARQRPDLEVLLVDASQVGLGATGRSTGIVGPGLSAPLRSMRRRYGDRVTTAAFASTMAGVTEIGRLIQSEQIDCDARFEQQTICALTGQQERRIRRHTANLRELGLSARWLDARDLRSVGGFYRAGFAYDDVLLVDPYRLVTGLASAAERRGVRVLERTRVQRIQQDGDQVLAHTPSGTIRAGQVLLAVDGYGDELNPHPSSVIPLRTHVVATAPLTSAEREALGWNGFGGVIDQRNFFSYYRLGVDDRLIFGGGPALLASGDPRRDALASAAVFRRVVDEMHQRFPAVRDVPVEGRWSGLTGATLDRLPVVGPVGESWSGSRVHFAGGWCGHGLAMCVSTALRYSTVLAGERPRADPLPWSRSSTAGVPSALLRSRGLPAYLRAMDLQDRTSLALTPHHPALPVRPSPVSTHTRRSS